MASRTRALPDSGMVTEALGPGAYAMYAFLALAAAGSIVLSGDAADILGFIGVTVGTGVTAVLFLRRARRFSGRERRGWTLIGLAVLFACIGIVSIGATYAATGDAPAFGLADLWFLGMYTLAIAGFGVLPHTQGSTAARWRMVVDGIVGAVFIGSVAWVYLGSLLADTLSEADPTTRFVGFAYPFIDLILLTVAVYALLRRSARRFDTRLAFFTVGIITQVIGDVIFVTSAVNGSFAEASPPYPLNLVGIGAYFTSAYLLSSSPAVREYPERDAPLWFTVAGYLPAFGMVVFFLFDTLRHRHADPVVLAATLIVGLLVIVRQGISITENRMTIERQRNALVSTISHELRTPLTAIKGFVEILGEEGTILSKDEEAEMLGIVAQQAEYMARIVSDLILLARDMEGTVALDVVRSDVSEVVASAVHASGLAPASLTVEVEGSIEADIDASRIQQVIVNLLTNADRYGGERVLLRVEAIHRDLVMAVHDDGDGIPKRYELRVWDRFERGSHRLNSTVPGSGIGLAIVRSIARAHGGTAVYSESAVLGGACFTVSIPDCVVTTPGASGSVDDVPPRMHATATSSPGGTEPDQLNQEPERVAGAS